MFDFYVKPLGVTLPETNIFAPENQWLVQMILSFRVKRPIFQGLLLLVLGSVINFSTNFPEKSHHFGSTKRQ